MSAGIGAPLPRVDGRRKVTGQARYVDDQLDGSAAHAVIVSAAIGVGRIRALPRDDAESLPGVLAVLTHENAPHLPYRPHRGQVDPQVGERLHVLQDDRVLHFGQPIAVVVAETLEQAQEAALLLRAEYEAGEPEIGLVNADAAVVAPTSDDEDPADDRRGDPGQALGQAAFRIEAEYEIARENHVAIEPHATVARWDGDRLTVFEKSQWVSNARDELAAVFGLEAANVRVISPFVGGAFGSALRTWPHATLAALAARVVGRPVRLALTRKQTFLETGFRPQSRQRVQAGAARDGRLTALDVETFTETSRYEQFAENVHDAWRMLYRCPNVSTRRRVVPRDVSTPTHMRAPGQATGVFALECALDELAHAAGLDPLELRRRNLPERDAAKNLPFSSCALRECLELGAQRIHWSARASRPGVRREGPWRLGLGMAATAYPMWRDNACATVHLRRDRTARVETASSDMGPGTYTSLTQVACEALELPPERIELVLGDSELPPGPPHGGSQTLASVGSAVLAACREARAALVEGRDEVHVTARSGPGDEAHHFSMYAFGAVFAEVGVEVDFGIVRVRRLVGTYAAGRIVNPLLARSQAIGGMVGGMGMALLEATSLDPRDGRITNPNLAEYRIPVNADVPELDVAFVPEDDPHVNPLGVKGLAEIAYTGVASAIANAVFDATGRRVRTLPIRLEQLL